MPPIVVEAHDDLLSSVALVCICVHQASRRLAVQHFVGRAMEERHYLSDLRGWNTRLLQDSIPHVAANTRR